MKPDVARELFDASAETYDRVNSVISLGLDARWRAWAAREAVAEPGTRVLDAFAGTGLVGLACARLGADVTLADISARMLAVARSRAQRAGLSVRFAQHDLTDAEAPSPPEAPFDAITMMFGARYLDDPAQVIGRLASWLRPEGRFVLVEFVEPSGAVLSRLAAIYFFRILPRIASALAGRRELYDTLVTTTHAMGPSASLVGLLENAGLEVEQVHLMGFGLVCGIVARP